ncbi:MAG TPA: DUF4232 domain-containing protein [Solirubrobacterales bacterium]|jgi:hypothetical protein|nr:DUF4232 domain-containing protein [Solirubrobacterales bacterium]
MKARLLIPSSVAAALLAAFVIASPAGAAPIAKPCSPANLVVWAGPQAGGGTAGGFGYEIKFTNLGKGTCTLAGFPGVRAVDLKGKRIGAAATHGPGKVKQIVLAPKQSAMATLQIADALNFPKAKCAPTMAAGLRVALPGGSGAKIAPVAFETCAKSSAKTLSVSAVKDL